ncbi:MAG: DUF4345 domain-containing protein [Cyanobacteria bacterium J06633_2]
MKRSTVSTMILCISGLLAIAIGIMILLSPVDFYAANQIPINGNINLLSEVRASAGALLASGLVITMGAFIPPLTFTSAILATMLYLSYGTSRIAGIVIDGMPTASLLYAAAIELIAGCCCLYCLWQQSNRRLAPKG